MGWRFQRPDGRESMQFSGLRSSGGGGEGGRRGCCADFRRLLPGEKLLQGGSSEVDAYTKLKCVLIVCGMKQKAGINC